MVDRKFISHDNPPTITFVSPLKVVAMGNATSISSSNAKRRDKKHDCDDTDTDEDNVNSMDVAARAQRAFGVNLREWQQGLANGVRKLEEQDHPAAALIDSFCGPYLDIKKDAKGSREGDGNGRRNRGTTVRTFYSEDVESEDDSRTVSEDETTTVTDYRNREQRRRGKDTKDDQTVESASYMSHSDYESTVDERRPRSSSTQKSRKTSGRITESSYETEDDDTAGLSANDDVKAGSSISKIKTSSSGSNPSSMLAKQPLASSFAKRCYFTKQGIGSTTQHYEGLTLTGNVVLMLAAAMKLKGCPTICDEDLRRVEQTYPNQFSRLPDELLLSSGWRRISKYCHFSNKPIPDGVPFFHSKQRLHASGGYYFLLAASVGMVRPIDVEPLTRDTLVLLETDFPTQCDIAPKCLIEDPDEWTLVDRFCFFSGGPINSDEDVYYQADFDGNPIYMLAFLSPSLTPAELYKLDATTDESDPILKLVAAVDEVESVYDLTDRDFDDLKLYHLGPCRALPQYILQPQAWTKVLPPHFLAAKEEALRRARDFEARHGLLREVTSSALAGHEYNPLQQQSQPLSSVASSRYMDFQQAQASQHHLDHNGIAYGQHFLHQNANTFHMQNHHYHIQQHVLSAPPPQHLGHAMQYEQYVKWQTDQQLLDPYVSQHGIYNPTSHQPDQTEHLGLLRERDLYEQTVQKEQYDQVAQLHPGQAPYEQMNQSDHQYVVSNDVDDRAPPMIYEQMGQPLQYEPRNHNDQYKVAESREQNERDIIHDHQYDQMSHDQYDQLNQLQAFNEQNLHSVYYNQPSDHSGSYTNSQQPNSLSFSQKLPSPSHQSQIPKYDPGSPFQSNPQNMKTLYTQNSYQNSWDGSAVSSPEATDTHKVLQRDVEEDGAFIDHTLPIDEALATHAARSAAATTVPQTVRSQKSQVDPPEDQPPSLHKPRHPHGLHAKNVFNSNYSAYSTEGSRQPSAYGDDDYSGSPEKSLGIGDEFRSDEYENTHYHPTEAISSEYLYIDQTESDPPTHDDDYENETNQILVRTQDSYICTDSEDPAVLSPVTDNDYTASPTSGSQFSIPVSDGEYGSMASSPLRGDGRNMNGSTGETRSIDGSKRDSGLPPHSPRSIPGSEFSQSSALRGAQELLRRNRARRLSTRKPVEDQSTVSRDVEEFEDPSTNISAVPSNSELESGGTWESTSEMTSVVSGSSVWTDNENNPDRSSRRALILQMAKARMKSNKSSTTPTSVNTKSVSTPKMVSEDENIIKRRHMHSDFEDNDEEKKFDYRDMPAEINLIGDLD